MNLQNALVSSALFLAFSASGTCQTQATTFSVSSFRPLADASRRLAELSKQPIYYEDVRCDFPGDQVVLNGQYTAAQQQQAAQLGIVTPLTDVAPRGGSLSTTIAVNSTGHLPDSTALAGAINSILSVYSASGLPGAFGVEQYNGAFFLAPTEIRNQTGATAKFTPVLSTPITFSVTQGVAFGALKQILAQVSQATGYRIDVGSAPVNALAMARVTINAVHEPANHVLMWFLNSLLGYGSLVPPNSPSFAYHMLYDPRLKYYMFNIVEIAPELATHLTAAPPSLPAQPSGPSPVGTVETKP